MARSFFSRFWPRPVLLRHAFAWTSTIEEMLNSGLNESSQRLYSYSVSFLSLFPSSLSFMNLCTIEKGHAKACLLAHRCACVHEEEDDHSLATDVSVM
jgi:hypothetical protein